MTKQEAIEIAQNKLDNLKEYKREPVLVMEASVYKFKYGWAVPYQSKEYVLGEKKKRGLPDMLIGIGPLILDENTGNIYSTGSAPFDFIEDYIKYREGGKNELSWIPM